MTQHNNTIAADVRKNIFSAITAANITWSGRLDEDLFLSRICDLTSLPAFDKSYKNAAEEIFFHRVKSYDWPQDWIINDNRFNLLNCNDDFFLSFLCETINPAVRFDLKIISKLLEIFNHKLKQYGWEIVPVDEYGQQRAYTSKKISDSEYYQDSDKVVTELTKEYLSSKKEAMLQTVNIKPTEAILLAKEHICSTCKTVLMESDNIIPQNNGLPQLMKKTLSVLFPDQKTKPSAGRYQDKKKWILNDLVNLCRQITEFCNIAPSAGNKTEVFKKTPKEDARLVCEIAAAVSAYLADSCQNQKRPLLQTQS